VRNQSVGTQYAAWHDSIDGAQAKARTPSKTLVVPQTSEDGYY
jgi:hypothetical protein